jgi:hypothetical protein
MVTKLTKYSVEYLQVDFWLQEKFMWWVPSSRRHTKPLQIFLQTQTNKLSILKLDSTK